MVISPPFWLFAPMFSGTGFLTWWLMAYKIYRAVLVGKSFHLYRATVKSEAYSKGYHCTPDYLRSRCIATIEYTVPQLLKKIPEYGVTVTNRNCSYKSQRHTKTVLRVRNVDRWSQQILNNLGLIVSHKGRTAKYSTSSYEHNAKQGSPFNDFQVVSVPSLLHFCRAAIFCTDNDAIQMNHAIVSW